MMAFPRHTHTRSHCLAQPPVTQLGDDRQHTGWTNTFSSQARAWHRVPAAQVVPVFNLCWPVSSSHAGFALVACGPGSVFSRDLPFHNPQG